MPVEGWFVDRFGPRSRGAVRRHHGSHRLVAQLVRETRCRCSISAPCSRRRRRGRGLWHLRRQRAEVVRRSPRPRRRPHRRRLRRRAPPRPFVPSSTSSGLTAMRPRVPLVRHRAGADLLRPLPSAEGAPPGQAPKPWRKCEPEHARLFSHRDAADAGLLGALRHVRAGRGERLGGHRPSQPDRQRLRHRQDRRCRWCSSTRPCW